MTARRLLQLVLLAGITVAGYFLSRPVAPPPTPGGVPAAPPDPARPPAPPADSGRPAPATAPLPTAPSPGTVPAAPAAAPYNPADFPIAAGLNARGATIQRDLDILQQLLDAWRTNFPREGNPVGENADITAALLGQNRLGLALVPRNHPAINARGELCDRWGTPFRFHQLSGERMELRSAGPDRRFATDDDAILAPP